MWTLLCRSARHCKRKPSAFAVSACYEQHEGGAKPRAEQSDEKQAERDAIHRKIPDAACVHWLAYAGMPVSTVPVREDE
jgi:hypothetical protein